MPKIVECVPNFSEGRHKEIIEAIANAIASSEGCSLLDVDPGVSTNRTVYTFIGTPETIVEGALAAARVAYQLIDMSRHSGEHPRMGALDVCPFIPVEGISMDECVQCAKEMGERLANELKVPVYLYGDASSEDHRKTLPQVRTGEYEGLPAKLCQPEWLPNYGPTEFVPSWGATAVGARKFLIAYNVNILGTKEQAHRIALNVREQRRSKNEQSGHLKKVQAIGWYLEEANMAQVSMNLLDFEVTPIHLAFEAVKKDAEELNLPIIGSQIIGMVPLKSLLNTAEYYMEKENLFILEEDQKLRLVVNKLGLHSLGQFNPKERIIDSGLRVSKDEIAAKYLPAIAGHLCESWDGYMVDEDKDGPLIRMSVKDFIMTVGCRSPSPGGGSVAALCASLGSALGSMVGFLTYGNRKFYELDSQIRRLIPSLYKAMKDLIPFVDADAAAFGEYMAALKMPQGTNEEKKQREDAMNQGLHTAIQVPLTVAKIANSVWPVMKELAQVGNINCKSDLQTGARVLETAVWGTYYNVLTNLKSIRDEDLKAEASGEIDKSLKMAQDNCTEVLTILDERQLREQ